LLVFYLGHKPEYRPLGLHKYEWDPVERELREAWVDTTVSSPNSVPFVAQASDLVYTRGSRDRQSTIEAVDWTTGEERFHYVLGPTMLRLTVGPTTPASTAELTPCVRATPCVSSSALAGWSSSALAWGF
jgi:hypothetical protein